MLPPPSQVAVIVLSCGFLPCARLLLQLDVARGRQGEGTVRLVSSLDRVGNVPPGASRAALHKRLGHASGLRQEHSLQHQALPPKASAHVSLVSVVPSLPLYSSASYLFL